MLMEETKRLTTALREGFTSDQKDEIRKKLEQIIKALEEKNSKNDSKNHLANH